MVTLQEVLDSLALREQVATPEGPERRALCEAVAVYVVSTNPERFKQEIATVAVERADLHRRIEKGRQR